MAAVSECATLQPAGVILLAAAACTWASYIWHREKLAGAYRRSLVYVDGALVKVFWASESIMTLCWGTLGIVLAAAGDEGLASCRLSNALLGGAIVFGLGAAAWAWVLARNYATTTELAFPALEDFAIFMTAVGTGVMAAAAIDSAATDGKRAEVAALASYLFLHHFVVDMVGWTMVRAVMKTGIAKSAKLLMARQEDWTPTVLATELR